MKNTILDCKGWKKWKWYFYVELKHLLFILTKLENEVFFEGNTIKNLSVNYWETKFFWLAHYTFKCLEEQVKSAITIE